MPVGSAQLEEDRIAARGLEVNGHLAAVVGVGGVGERARTVALGIGGVVVVGDEVVEAGRLLPRRVRLEVVGEEGRRARACRAAGAGLPALPPVPVAPPVLVLPPVPVCPVTVLPPVPLPPVPDSRRWRRCRPCRGCRRWRRCRPCTGAARPHRAAGAGAVAAGAAPVPVLEPPVPLLLPPVPAALPPVPPELEPPAHPREPSDRATSERADRPMAKRSEWGRKSSGYFIDPSRHAQGRSKLNR